MHTNDHGNRDEPIDLPGHLQAATPAPAVTFLRLQQHLVDIRHLDQPGSHQQDHVRGRVH